LIILKDYKTNKSTGLRYWPEYTVTLKTESILIIKTVFRKKYADKWYAIVASESVEDHTLNLNPDKRLINCLEYLIKQAQEFSILGEIDLTRPDLHPEDYLQIEERDRLKNAYNYIQISPQG
jgi:hypothetical protein